MRAVRSHLDREVDAVVADARALTDWRHYFRAHPWVWLGAAAVAGFVLVPPKRKTATLDQAALAELARRREIVVAAPGTSTSEWAVSSLARIATSALIRAAIAIAGKHLNRFIDGLLAGDGAQAAGVREAADDRK